MRHSQRLPVAVIAATPRPAGARGGLIHRNPCRTAEVLWEVPLGTVPEIEEAAEVCEEARRPWARSAPFARADFLERWARRARARRGLLTDLIVREVGKPRRAAEEEIGPRRGACAHCGRAGSRSGAVAARRAGVVAAQRPLGVVGLVTPWNNPLAIPVGKIAPALGLRQRGRPQARARASATALAIAREPRTAPACRPAS